MAKVAFVAEVVARAIGEGSVKPTSISTNVSRSTQARVLRVLVEEGYLAPSSRGIYTPGPKLRETTESSTEFEKTPPIGAQSKVPQGTPNPVGEETEETADDRDVGSAIDPEYDPITLMMVPTEFLDKLDKRKTKHRA